METVKTFLIIMLLIYSAFISYMYYVEYTNRDNYLKDKVNFVSQKHEELNRRENEVLGKEKCMIELTKLRTINKSALDILQSYKDMATTL